MLQELILTSEGEWNLSKLTSRISVSNCHSVRVANNSLVQMEQLSSVEFVNVLNLTLTRDSFKVSPKVSKTRFSVRNCSIDVLPSNVFHGDVEAITFEQVRIGQVSAFAFANLLNTDSVTLTQCNVSSLESLAFKKFECRYLHVIGGTLGDQIPSRAMIDVEVSDQFMLDGVKIGKVDSSAFTISRPNTVAIINCAIDTLGNEAFDLTVRGTVIIQNNTFGNVALGAFLSIRTDSENKVPSATSIMNPKKLLFKDNVLNGFEEGSLVFDRSSFRVELSNVLVNQVCDCDQLKVWRAQIQNYTNAYPRLITSARDSGNVIAPAHTLESGVDDPDAFFCLDEQDSSSSTSFVAYESRNCVLGSSLLALVLSISGLLVVLLTAASVVVYCCRKRRREERDKRWISVPTSAPDVLDSKAKKNGSVVKREASPVDSRITMVVPDGRLYRETEFHVIVEKAEPLTTEL